MNIDELLKMANDMAELDDHETHVIELLAVYLSKRPVNPRAWLMYGESLRLQFLYNEALEAMKTSLEQAPEEKKPKVMGRIAFLCGEFLSPTKAEKWYKKAAEHEFCDEGWIWLYRALNSVKLGDFDNAITFLNISKKFNDIDDSEVYLNLGLVYRAKRQYKTALEYFSKALQIDEKYDEARRCLEGLQNIDETISILKKYDTK